MFAPLYSYLKTYVIQNSWEDEYTRNGARSIFTTICLCCNIDADTAICDQLLAELYQMADIQSTDVSREEFDNFMLEYIV